LKFPRQYSRKKFRRRDLPETNAPSALMGPDARKQQKHSAHRSAFAGADDRLCRTSHLRWAQPFIVGLRLGIAAALGPAAFASDTFIPPRRSTLPTKALRQTSGTWRAHHERDIAIRFDGMLIGAGFPALAALGRDDELKMPRRDSDRQGGEASAETRQ